MKRTRRFACALFALAAALEAGIVVACAGHSGPPAAASALGRTRDAAPIPDDPRTGKLVFVAQQPLLQVPDAWEPRGRAVGQGDHCDVWDVPTGFFRGAVDPAVCAAWKGATHVSPDGAWSAEAHAHTMALSPIGAADAGSAAAFDLVETCPDAKACPPIVAFAWSPDSAFLATVRKETPTVTVWDVKSRTVRTTLVEGKSENLPKDFDTAVLGWSAAGVSLMPASRGDPPGTFATWDPETGKSDVSFPEGITAEAAIDPYGRFLFRRGVYPTARGDEMEEEKFQEVVVLDKTLPSNLAWTPADSVTPLVARWSHDGSHVVSAVDTEMTVIPLTGGEPWLATLEEKPAFAIPSWDGKRIAVLSSGVMRIATFEDRSIAKVVGITEGEISGAEWSADGAHLAIQYDGRTEVRPIDKKGVELFWGNTVSVFFAPRGLLLAANLLGGRVQVQDVASHTKVFEAAGSVAPGSWSNDGAHLAVLSATEVTIWSTLDGTKERSIARPKTTDVAFSPRGDGIALGGAMGASIVDVATGKVRATIATPPVARVLWPAGTEGAGARIFLLREDDDDGVTVVDASTGAAVAGPKTKLGHASDLAPNGAWAALTPGTVTRIADGEELTARAGGVVSRNGLFDGSPATVADRVYRLGDDPINGTLLTEDCFADKLAHPGLMSDFAHGKALPVPAAMLERVGPPPSLTLATSDAGPTGDAGSQPSVIEFAAHDEGGGIAVCRAFLDGEPLQSWKETGGASIATHALTIDPPIDGKRHVVTLDACNQVGAICSARLRVNLPIRRLPKKKK